MRTLTIVFKRIGNEVLAVFPFERWSYYEVASYAHVGQHGGCHWAVPYELRTATPEEYLDLLNELKDIYDDCQIKVLKRMPSRAKVINTLNHYENTEIH